MCNCNCLKCLTTLLWYQLEKCLKHNFSPAFHVIMESVAGVRSAQARAPRRASRGVQHAGEHRVPLRVQHAPTALEKRGLAAGGIKSCRNQEIPGKSVQRNARRSVSVQWAAP